MTHTNLSQSITKSLFALINTNAGEFKSEKQAQFILNHTLDNVHIAEKRVSFGEFNGCVRVIEYMFTLDSKGVVKVTKTSKTTGKSTVYFDRNNATNVKAFADKTAAKNQRQVKVEAINTLRSRLDEVDGYQKVINNLVCNYVMTMSPEQIINDPRMIKLASVTKKIERNIKRLEVKYTQMLQDF